MVLEMVGRRLAKTDLLHDVVRIARQPPAVLGLAFLPLIDDVLVDLIVGEKGVL
jgi:hypothetical protein